MPSSHDSQHSGFGRPSPYLNRKDLSYWLVEAVYRDLRADDPFRTVTQALIADQLNVEQPMIALVKRKNRAFSRKVFEGYAKSRGNSLGDLVQYLLSLANAKVQTHEDAAPTMSIPELMIDSFQELERRICNERRLSSQPKSVGTAPRAFDFELAFCHLLDVLMNITGRIVGSVYSASIILCHSESDVANACQVFGRINDRGDRFTRRMETIALPSQVLGLLKENRSNDPGTVFLIDSSNLTTLNTSDTSWAWKAPTCKKATFAITSLSSEYGARSMPIPQVYMTVMCDHVDGSNPSSRVDIERAMFRASRIADQIFGYILADRLRSIQLLMSDPTFRQSHANLVERNTEIAEHRISEFLDDLCDGGDFKGVILSADIWYFDARDSRFSFRSDCFARVSKWERDRKVRLPDGEECAFEELYSSSIRKLAPRPFGRSMSVLANQTAVILDRIEGTTWSSIPELEVGTLIGFPFALSSGGGDGDFQSELPSDCGIYVLYVRCTKYVESSKARRIVRKIFDLMNSNEHRRYFTPMVVVDDSFYRRDRKSHDYDMKHVARQDESVKDLSWEDVWFEATDLSSNSLRNPIV